MNEMSNVFQTSKRSNVYRKSGWHRYDPVGVAQIISRHDVISILSLRDKSVTEKMCVTNEIRKIKMVSEKWFVQIINEIRSAQMFVKKRFARILKRIRRIQMFIEQRFAEEAYDPVGVAQIISRYDAINILSLRDESATEKFILSTNKIEKI